MSVVYVHCTVVGDYNLFSTGAFGVDIFFIISGFIIAHTVSKTTKFFFIKRIFRIVPLYFLTTVAMTLTVVLFPSFVNKATVSISGFIKSILFIPCIENLGRPILVHGWSLNYEMLFYVIMFLCILFIKNKKYLTIACISVLTLITIMLYLTNTTNFIINYYKTGLFLEFIYGMILYHIYIFINKYKQARVRDTPIRTVRIILLLCLAIGSYGILIYLDLYRLYFLDSRSLYYGIPALLLVMAILFMEEDIKENKIIRFGIKLGEASYVMYLIHYHIVMFLSRVVFNKLIGTNNSLTIELIKIIIAFIVTIAFSIVIYRFVDKPIQKLLKTLY